MDKVIQLYETCLVRHGIMLVGPAGSGKTTIQVCPALLLCRTLLLQKTAVGTDTAFRSAIVLLFALFGVQEVLAAALSGIQVEHTAVKMNPKAITPLQMYGSYDANRDWTDGIFTVLWRKSNKNNSSKTWIICDGPVDPIWIESLNTVLDASQILMLI